MVQDSVTTEKLPTIRNEAEIMQQTTMQMEMNYCVSGQLVLKIELRGHLTQKLLKKCSTIESQEGNKGTVQVYRKKCANVNNEFHFKLQDSSVEQL